MAEEVKEERVAVENIRPQYPVMWERFLEVKGQTDQVELTYQDIIRHET